MERGQCFCLASGGLSSTCPVSSLFTYSPDVTGAFPAIALVLNPRGGGFAYILSLCGSFNQSLLKTWQFLPPPQPPLVLTARSYGDLSFWHWNPELCCLAWSWDCLLLRYPSRFLSTTHECGTTHSATTLSLHTALPISSSLPFLTIWMHVASFSPWLSDFYTA